MPSWIEGYALREGPSETGVSQRFAGARERDGVPAWIRVDGYPPDDEAAAAAIAAAYHATCELDHPDLPRLLDAGSTDVPGRPFLAFQRAEATKVGNAKRPRLREIVALLTEIQLLAYECGFAGVHIPPSELDRARRGYAVPFARLPFREFLAEPRGAPGHSALRGVEPEAAWTPFAAPETLVPGRRYSVKQALVYRLAAQARYLLQGDAPLDVQSEHRRSLSTISLTLDPDEERLLAAALDPLPPRRPPLEELATLPARGETRRAALEGGERR